MTRLVLAEPVGRVHAPPAMRSACHSLTAISLTGVLLVAASIAFAPRSAADATANLRAAVDSARGSCAPLAQDPVLERLAQRENGETRAYIEHQARFMPFEDPSLVLRTLGYTAGKAKLVAGYGDIEEKAIHGVIVQGWQAIPDCSYTKYGVDAVNNTDGGTPWRQSS